MNAVASESNPVTFYFPTFGNNNKPDTQTSEVDAICLVTQGTDTKKSNKP
jgi:hypothetical protein